MPGLKRSPGLADVDVCQGAYGTGSSALQQAYLKAQWSFDGVPVKRTASLNHSRYPVYPEMSRSMPSGYPESPSNDSNSSSPPVHEGFENLESRITRPVQAKSHSFDSGLPPTPPTLNNSDVSREVTQEELASPPPMLADGVRNALHSKQSGQSTTPVNAVSPPTPDPSPPVTTEDVSAMHAPNATLPKIQPPAMEEREKPQFLHPLIARSTSAHFLREYPSSRADSFQTAHEEQPRSPRSSLASPVHLPDDDRLPQHWLDSSRELRLATLGLGNMTVAETPKVNEADPEPLDSTPKTSRRRSKHDSPPQTAHADSDWEKHISYVSGPDDLDGNIASNDANMKKSLEATKENVRGLGLTGPGFHQPNLEKSAEDVNNMVYKRIQEENVRRHSVISTNSGAITVGIVLPADSTPRTLKRQTKCLSLREDTNSSNSKRGSVDSTDKKLVGHKKIRAAADRSSKKLEASPVFESSIRQVSSPARLGPDASNMTALTYASMQDSPSARKSGLSTSRIQPISEHKLRHLSYGDRLSNNFSVRRTSLHGSPTTPSPGFEIFREPEYPARHVSGAVKPNGDKAIMNNVGIKRSSTEGARPSRVLEKPRGVIPSVTSDGPDDILERSPTTARLRRFSREERLENNEAVRRTSVDHSKVANWMAETPERGLETNRDMMPDNVSLPSPPDRLFFPTSPRKSLDARFLHPTTTPMSVSQFSDRTEVELCEASGVRIYPHNNESLLVVQHGSRPTSKGKSSNADGYDLTEADLKNFGKPIFAAQIDPPTPTLGTKDPVTTMDSPLTNPRAAPEPPVIQFIPPTPNDELERNPIDEQQRGNLRTEVNLPQRRLTLLQRARRYSDSLFVRTGSFRKPRRPAPEDRDAYLSPLWRPQGFWDDFDSEDEEDFEAAGALPKGGDTSDVGEDEQRRRGLLPRAMSKRLPGFRGAGGFLVGNSLGLDRHGTNNRRHYVSTTTRTLSKRASEELLRSLTSNGAVGGPQASQDSLRRIAKARTFVVPFSGGKRAQWVGTQRFRARVRSIRLAREERGAEKRRQAIKVQIGSPNLRG